MKTTAKIVLATLAIGAIGLFGGCGGGGGSSDSGGGSAAALTANKVEITEANAPQVIAEAISGRDVDFGILSASETPSISKNASAIEIVRFVRDLTKRASPTIAINSAIVPLATATESCEGGGTVTINGSESDFTTTFKNCVEGGVKLNGTVRIVELGWSGYDGSVKAIENVTMTDGSTSIYINASFELGESSYKQKIANANIYMKITEYSETYEVALSNYNETYDETTYPDVLKYSGAVGYREGGYHFAAGVTGDLQGIDGCYGYPESGYETVAGSKDTKAKITYNELSTPQVRVVLNDNETNPIFEGTCSDFDSWLDY
ncbi:hypothetical protein FACS189487_04150 [Campylobacterota bacterium]|nr:hypothetical protein FACS189487_04150 [Campylobacterota bacterium]